MTKEQEKDRNNNSESELSAEELKQTITTLLSRLRETLSNLPEFQQTAAQNLLYDESVDKSVSFTKDGLDYKFDPSFGDLWLCVTPTGITPYDAANDKGDIEKTDEYNLANEDFYTHFQHHPQIYTSIKTDCQVNNLLAVERFNKLIESLTAQNP